VEENNKAEGFQTSNIYLKITTNPIEMIQSLIIHISDNLSEYEKISYSCHRRYGLGYKRMAMWPFPTHLNYEIHY